MAEDTFSDPDFEIRLRVDWAGAENDAQQGGATFGNEGTALANRSPIRINIPDYNRATGAAEQFSRVIERQTKLFEDATKAGARALPYYGMGPSPGNAIGIGSGPVPWTQGPVNINIPNGPGGGGGGALPPGAGGSPWAGPGSGGSPWNWSPGTGLPRSPYFAPGGAPGQGGGGGGNQTGSYLWRRFLAIEGLRIAGGVIALQDTDEQKALGNPAAIAQLQLARFNQGLNAMPFGIGEIVRGLAIDPGGHIEGGIQGAIAGAQQVQQTTNYQYRAMNTLFAARENRDVAFSPQGLQKNLARVQAESAQHQRDIDVRVREKDVSVLEQDRDRHRSEIEARMQVDREHRLWYSNTSFTKADEPFLRDIQLNDMAYNSQIGRALKRGEEEKKIIGDEAKHQSDLLITQTVYQVQGMVAQGAAQQAYGALAAGIPGGTGLLSRDFQKQNLLGLQAIQMDTMAKRFQADMNLTSLTHPELVEGLKATQRGEYNQLVYEQGMARAGQTAQWAANDQATELGARGNAWTAYYLTQRQPRTAIGMGITTRQELIKQKHKVQGTTGSSVEQAELGEAEQQGANQLREFDDTTQRLKLSMGTQEKVTGLLAQAYGPGGHLKRLQAQAAQISGQTNEDVLALQQQGRDMSFLDQRRRIGINQLKAIEANYLQGFNAAEGSLNRTNFSPQGATESPQAVLQSIDNEIKQMNGKMGTLVATD